MNTEYEKEWTPDAPQEDMIYVLNGRGQLMQREVVDDVTDD